MPIIVKKRKRKPRRGSLQFWPRKRARREVPRISSWPESKEPKLLGFAGYKAGMTHLLAIDRRKDSPTVGQEIQVPVTILETPPLVICGMRLYKKTEDGLEVVTEVWADRLDEELKRIIQLPKKKVKKGFREIEKGLDQIDEVRAIVHTQPKLASVPKKKPELMEMGLGGTVKEKFEYLKKNLGKKVKIKDAFKIGDWIDTVAVTKGKGFQGVVKRFGVKMLPRKDKKGRRRVASIGPWGPRRVRWTVPMPGQMGYHTRTQFNSRVMKIGENGEEVTPQGGLIRYGQVKGGYLLVKGSVPGPKKRLVRLRKAIRPPSVHPPIEITYISTKSQQG